MTRPLLGITCCTRQLGTETAQAVIDRYVVAAMRYADTDAVLIPALPNLVDAANVISRLDGILLTGSPSNVVPQRYGDAGGDGPFDANRDAIAFALIEAARARAKPLFGVCRGLQEINVAFGGTLRRDLGTTRLRHHAAADVPFDAMFDHCHSVELAPGGILSRAFGRDEVMVNSVHYQGVERLGEGLTVEAVAADGQVEGIAAPGVLAIQWHPEWRPEAHADRAAFFTLLGRALRGTSCQELA